MRVIGYVRVSTEDQSANGISLDAQRHRIRSYCDAHGHELADIEADEGLSARRMDNRPGLVSALDRLRLRGGAGGIVVAKLDRLSRTTRDVLDLVARAEKEGWALHSIDEHLDTGSPHGRFVVTILAALAQMEREQGSARTRSALGELRRQGRRISGRPPFGYRFAGRRVVPVPAEQALLSRIMEMARGAGGTMVAKILNGEGIPNPRTGRAWSAGTMRSIIRNAGKRSG